MSAQMEKPPKIGTEITVRISLTFQEAPDVHTLLAMTPVRERGKLVRLALERYIAETDHPAGDVERQIHAISTWLRSRIACTKSPAGAESQIEVNHTIDAGVSSQFNDFATPLLACSDPILDETISRSNLVSQEVDTSSSSIKRWLQT